MADELISKKTHLELREYCVTTTLSKIANEFDSADVTLYLSHSPNVSGQRHMLVEQYYHRIDCSRWADARKFVTVFENVLTDVKEQAQNGIVARTSASSH